MGNIFRPKRTPSTPPIDPYPDQYQHSDSWSNKSCYSYNHPNPEPISYSLVPGPMDHSRNFGSAEISLMPPPNYYPIESYGNYIPPPNYVPPPNYYSSMPSVSMSILEPPPIPGPMPPSYTVTYPYPINYPSAPPMTPPR